MQWLINTIAKQFVLDSFLIKKKNLKNLTPKVSLIGSEILLVTQKKKVLT